MCRTNRSTWLVSVLIGAWLASGACEQQSASSDASGAPPATGPIRVGHYGSLTGPQASFGVATSNGIRMAIEEFNAAGGLNGRRIELIEYDTKGDAREAGAVVQRLVSSDRVVAVLGEVASGLSLAAAPICQENRVPMISPSSTNPRVTKAGDYIFRICFIDPFQGYVGAKFAREQLQSSRAACLFDQSAPYSVGLNEAFRKEYTALGGTITTEQAYNEGDQDFTAQLSTIRATNPDLVYIPGYYTDVANIALQARRLGITVPLLGGDGWESPKLVDIGGAAIEGAYFSNHYSPEDPDPRIQAYVAKYKAKYGDTPESMATLGYDAAVLLFDAMKRAKSLAGPDLRDAISATKDFQGVTGKVTIDQDRNAVKPAVILQVREGKMRWVATVEPRR
ncbi:MAG: ABC transporter substrate-binding protein [Phycisphaerales bacterium]|nr:ABC transporter substrate-binding protein [Phycisphaerales bacterium]